MILMPQIFDVTANENARYKRNELEYLAAIQGRFKPDGHCFLKLYIPDSMTMLGQRWHSVVRLAYGWGWKYNVGPTLPLR